MTGSATAALPVAKAPAAGYWKRNQRRLAPFIFLAPGVFMFAVYVVAPIFESIWISFYDWDGLGEARWVAVDLERPSYRDQLGHAEQLERAVAALRASGRYAVVFDEDGVLVLHRTR